MPLSVLHRLAGRKRARRTAYRPRVEGLESLVLPSVTLTPAQVVHAYGISQIQLPHGGGRADGAHTTIAIVEEGRDPAFVGTGNTAYGSSDLARFDRRFHLADPPALRIFGYDTATGTLVRRTQVHALARGQAGEYSLDVEWAHAIAPGAAIDVIEFNPTAKASLPRAMHFAASLPHVSVVSASYGFHEFAGETGLDHYFTTPHTTYDPATGQVTAGHSGVTYVASSGDGKKGYGIITPSTSPNVLATGATALYLNHGQYVTEKAWAHSQGGTSAYQKEPAFQQAVNTTGFRQTPDVAMVGSNVTPVATLSSWTTSGKAENFRTWGTSVAAPEWAGLLAITNELRRAHGLSPLDGVTQTLPRLYQLPSIDFHPITAVDNPANLAKGDPRSTTLSATYNLFTGLGSPVANRLVPDLAGVAQGSA